MNTASVSPSISVPPNLRDSPLRPDCAARDRLFRWRGVNTPRRSTLDVPWLRALDATVLQASISDAAGYGSGIKKFHTFCDVFSVPEEDRLPASFDVLYSFVLWASADASTSISPSTDSPPTSPVSESTIRHYLAAVRAWHLAQGWDPPLSDGERDRINFALRGVAKLQAERHTKPIRPPVTITMLRLVKRSLDLNTPFDACVWAIITCAFWGMMRLGEATVKCRDDFKPSKSLTRRDAITGSDQDGRLFMRLDLPAAKTARPGDKQSVWLVPQGDLCAVGAIQNLARVVPARALDPLFSWRDIKMDIRPMAKPRLLERVNAILATSGIPRIYGHSFRIGGASFYMANKVDPEIVRLAGRWRSLSYEAYLRSFEQVVSRHLADLPDVRSVRGLGERR